MQYLNLPRFFSFIVIIILASGCAKSPTGRNQLMLVSPESAINSSRQAYIQTMAPLEKEGKIDSNPEQAKRVRYITGRLISQAMEQYPKTSSWDWSIKVIDDPETVNAWCMAGGKMAVYTGLINKVQPTDDELAQVIGHEISHALANHTAEKMSTALATQVGLLGIVIATGDHDNRGAIVAGSVAAATLGITLPNSRAAETEADRMGIELAARAGYNPEAAATLWQKMGRVGGKSPPQFLSTHPAPGNRQHTLQQLVEQMKPYYLDSGERPVYQFSN